MSNIYAYIDAGTGSYLLAAIASGAAGTWFFIRSQFAKLRGRGDDSTAPETAIEETVVAEVEPSSTDA